MLLNQLKGFTQVSDSSPATKFGIKLHLFVHCVMIGSQVKSQKSKRCCKCCVIEQVRMISWGDQLDWSAQAIFWGSKF